MPNRNITDVFFDLDHTLWDFDRNSALAFEKVFQKHKIELEVSKFIQAYEPINLIYWKKYRDELITKEELRRGRLIDTFQIFEMEMPLPAIDFMANSYIEELPVNNHLFSGAFELLDYLFAKYRLHIITNGFNEVQHIKLENSGINRYFNTITTSEEIGVKKPNPVIFKAAMAKALVSPDRSIMIGDNLEADIEGARNSGMQTLFFNYKNEQFNTPGLAVTELLQIKNCL